MMKLNIQLFAYNTEAKRVDIQSSKASGYYHKIQLVYYFNVDDVNRQYTVYAREDFYHGCTDGDWTNSSPYNRLIIDGVTQATTKNSLGAPSGSGTFALCPSFKNNTYKNMGTFNYDVNGNGSSHTIEVGCGYASSWAGISRKTLPYTVTPPPISPAASEIVSVSHTNNTITVTYKKYNTSFIDYFTVKDANNIYTFTNNDSGQTRVVGNNSITITLNKDNVAYISSQQNTKSPSFNIYMDTKNGNTVLGSQSTSCSITIPASTFSNSSVLSSVEIAWSNDNSYLRYQPSFTQYSSNNIYHMLHFYACYSSSSTNNSSNFYGTSVTNGTTYTIPESYLNPLYSKTSNMQVYLYCILNTYTTGGGHDVYLGSYTSKIYTVSLPSITLNGSTTTTETVSALNAYKNGDANKIVIQNQSIFTYNLAGYLNGYTSKTSSIYGESILRSINGISVSSASNTINFRNYSSLPSTKIYLNRAGISAINTTPSGMTFVAYSLPSVSYEYYRSDQNGNNTGQTGDYITLKIRASYTNLTDKTGIKNSALHTATIYYKRWEETSEPSSWTSVTSNVTNFTQTIQVGSDAYRKSYSLKLYFVDQLNNQTTQILYVIPPGRPGMYGYKSGADNHTIINDYLNVDGQASATKYHTIDLTWGGADNRTEGYRKIATFSTPASWSNQRLVFAISSRHTGNGIVCVSCGNNSSTANNNYGRINYYGTTDSGSIIADDSFQLCKNSDGTQMYLWWKYSDYNNARVTLLSTTGVTLSNGTWVNSPATNIPDIYFCGTLINNATKLGTATLGSATQPIYLNGGTATAGTALAAGAYRGVKSLSTQSHSGWGTNNDYVPDMSFIAYWNGAYNSSGTSNLNRCVNGQIIGSNNFPVGSIVVKDANSSPNLPGTWQLIDKELTPRYIYSEDTTYFTRTNASANALRIDISGHTITIDGQVTTSAKLQDSTVALGTFKLSSFTDILSSTSDSHARFITAYTDAGNCVVMLELTAAGVLQSIDVIPDSYVSSGNSIAFEVTLTIPYTHLVDSACNKFFFKRIS